MMQPQSLDGDNLVFVALDISFPGQENILSDRIQLSFLKKGCVHDWIPPAITLHCEILVDPYFSFRIKHTKECKYLNPMGPAHKGYAYERHIRECLMSHGVKCGRVAQSANRPDLTFDVDGDTFGIEIKTRGAFEAGQHTVKLIDNKLYFHGHTLFDGRVPSFMKGDKSKETWASEKHLFNQYYDLDNPALIAYMYRLKGCAYIQIQGKGLFHTGRNPLNLDVHFLRIPVRMRARCKQHKGKVPSSVMVSLTYKYSDIPQSSVDLERWEDDKLGRLLPSIHPVSPADTEEAAPLV